MHLNFATDRILDAQLNAALQFRQHNLKSGTCGNLNGFVIQVQCEFQVGHVTQTPRFPANTSSASCRESRVVKIRPYIERRATSIHRLSKHQRITNPRQKQKMIFSKHRLSKNTRHKVFFS